MRKNFIFSSCRLDSHDRDYVLVLLEVQHVESWYRGVGAESSMLETGFGSRIMRKASSTEVPLFKPSRLIRRAEVTFGQEQSTSVT